MDSKLEEETGTEVRGDFDMPDSIDHRNNGENTQNQDEEVLGRGHRRKDVSTRLRDYVIHTVKSSSPSIVTPTS